MKHWNNENAKHMSKNQPITKDAIITVLQSVPDPELNVSIWDLGLVYEVHVEPETNNVRILMTLTSIGCPLFSTIESQMKESLEQISGVGAITIDLTFEPPWTMERMSQDAKLTLGMA